MAPNDPAAQTKPGFGYHTSPSIASMRNRHLLPPASA